MAPVGLWGRKWSSLLAFGEKRRKAEVSTPLLCYRAERVWKAGGLRSERSGERQTSGSALPHLGKSFGIGVDAEMPDVLPGVWFGSLASVIEYICGLTAGIRLIPCC